jgi:methylenetetrahydrofolate--tRNA-(uracil-5-)-methyltransferase
MATGEPLSSPPRTTAIGALAYYVSHADPAHYDPSNITFGIIEPMANAPRSKAAKKLAISERALADLERWRDGLKAVPYTDNVGHGLQTVPNR